MGLCGGASPRNAALAVIHASWEKGSAQSVGRALCFYPMAPDPTVPWTDGPATGAVDCHAGLKTSMSKVSLQRQIDEPPMDDDAGFDPFPGRTGQPPELPIATLGSETSTFKVSLQRQIVR